MSRPAVRTRLATPGAFRHCLNHVKTINIEISREYKHKTNHRRIEFTERLLLINRVLCTLSAGAMVGLLMEAPKIVLSSVKQAQEPRSRSRSGESSSGMCTAWMTVRSLPSEDHLINDRNSMYTQCSSHADRRVFNEKL